MSQRRIFLLLVIGPLTGILAYAGMGLAGGNLNAGTEPRTVIVGSK